MKPFQITISILFLMIISSCGNNQQGSKESQSSMLFTSGGRTSEVLVVMSDRNWDSVIGDTIRGTLGEVPAWLAQHEPEYLLSQIKKVQLGTVYKKFRNILMVELDSSLTQTKIIVKHNVWAKPQTIIKIQSPNTKSYLSAYTKTYGQIMDYYHKNELLRIADTYKGMEVRTISNELAKKFSIKMVLPKGFYTATNDLDFMWLRKSTADIEEGIMIYTYPYSDTAIFNYRNINQVRDSITHKYIPGPIDHSFMKVSSYFPSAVKTVDFHGNYATQVRGLWDVKSYPMGGPYINYTYVDTISNRVVTLDGYIQAPKKDKRDLLLHLEAIFSTFEFINDNETTKD